jgi:hypothetical protein
MCVFSTEWLAHSWHARHPRTQRNGQEVGRSVVCFCVDGFSCGGTPFPYMKISLLFPRDIHIQLILNLFNPAVSECLSVCFVLGLSHRWRFHNLGVPQTTPRTPTRTHPPEQDLPPTPTRAVIKPRVIKGAIKIMVLTPNNTNDPMNSYSMNRTTRTTLPLLFCNWSSWKQVVRISCHCRSK